LVYLRFLRLGYKLDGFLRELAPFGIFGKDLSSEDFTAAYSERLDGIGADVISARLEGLRTASPSGRVVALCYEPIGQFCHRRLAAAWFEQHLGLVVPELQPEQGCWHDDYRGNEPGRDRAYTSKPRPAAALVR
jgi:hypothetical protein